MFVILSFGNNETLKIVEGTCRYQFNLFIKASLSDASLRPPTRLTANQNLVGEMSTTFCMTYKSVQLEKSEVNYHKYTH